MHDNVRGSIKPTSLQLDVGQVDSEEDLITVFVDPSSEDRKNWWSACEGRRNLSPAQEAPGWPLQNALVLLAKYRPGKRRILAFRSPAMWECGTGVGRDQAMNHI